MEPKNIQNSWKSTFHNYNLENHKGDPAYASWDEAYQEFQKQEEQHAQTVLDLKADVEKSSEIQKQMKEAKSLAEWQKLVSDNRFTLIVAGTQKMLQISEYCQTGD